MNIIISVYTGTYKTVEAAAFSEKSINWWDDTDTNQIICSESYAALEIYNHLKLSGAKVIIKSIVRDRSEVDKKIVWDRSDQHVRVIVGKTAIIQAGLKPRLAGRDGSYSCSYIEGSKTVLIWGDQYNGTLNAAHEWLRSIGFRWYTPDKNGTVIPKIIRINECCTELNFDFKTRACYNEFIDDDNPGFINWASRNCMNMLRVNEFLNPHKDKKLGLKIMGGGHEIFYRYLNPNSTFLPADDNESTYFDLHPEWFALIDGKRSRRDENVRATEGYYTGDNICTSNIHAVRELAQNMLVSINSGDYRYIDYLNLWAYDNGKWCSCKECKAVGNLSRRMLMLGYNINIHFKKAYEEGRLKRRIKLVIPVYHETLEPPNKPLPDDFDYEHIIATYFPIERCYAHNIDDKKCTEANLSLCTLFESWTDSANGNYKGEIFIGEYYNVSSFASLPFIFTETMQNDIPYYFRTGARHLYYMHISARNWGMLALNNFVLAGLMRDIEFNASKAINEFYELYYPDYGKVMATAHTHLKKASLNSKYLKHYQFSSEKKIFSLISEVNNKTKFPLEHCKFDERTENTNSSISFSETMSELKAAGLIIEKAYEDASDTEKERISIEKMRFEYGLQVMTFIYKYVQLKTAYDMDDSDTIENLFFDLEELRNNLMLIKKPLEEMKYECPWYENAYEATWHSKGYDEIRSEIIKKLNI